MYSGKVQGPFGPTLDFVGRQKNPRFSSVKSMSCGKSPGLDGFPVEFYKMLPPRALEALVEMYNESLSKGSLPSSLLESNISLLLKSNKDPLQLGSY